MSTLSSSSSSSNRVRCAPAGHLHLGSVIPGTVETMSKQPPGQDVGVRPKATLPLSVKSAHFRKQATLGYGIMGDVIMVYVPDSDWGALHVNVPWG